MGFLSPSFFNEHVARFSWVAKNTHQCTCVNIIIFYVKKTTLLMLCFKTVNLFHWCLITTNDNISIFIDDLLKNVLCHETSGINSQFFLLSMPNYLPYKQHFPSHLTVERIWWERENMPKVSENMHNLALKPGKGKK